MATKPPASLFDLHYKWSNAYFSPCRTWRYLLHRVWSVDHQLLLVVGLNPSTADEVQSVFDLLMKNLTRNMRDVLISYLEDKSYLDKFPLMPVLRCEWVDK